MTVLQHRTSAILARALSFARCAGVASRPLATVSSSSFSQAMADKEGVMKTLQSNNSSLVFARGFAAPADPFGGAELEPPLKMYGTSAKYATALWAAATKAKVLDKVTKEIDEVLSLKNADARFAGFLDDPTVPYEKKIEGLKKVFESGTFTDITKNFFFVLAENGRLEELSAVSEQYAKLVYASRGQVVVKVTSAIPLSADQLAKCKDVLTKKVLQKGETLVMELNVDRKILGGLVFQIGEKHIDLSIEARIKKIENLLRDAADSI